MAPTHETNRNLAFHINLKDDGKPMFRNNEIHTNKYNIFTFLPRNLFEQFTRIANFYFLIIVILLQFPFAPISATAAVAPLTIVIGISAIREAIEDILRYRSDSRINSKACHVFDHTIFRDKTWGQIMVGNFVKVLREEEVPSDLVLFATSNKDGSCYIETCNLDGETNLKPKRPFNYIRVTHYEDYLRRCRGYITCDPPNKELYRFRGYAEISDQRIPLSNDNIILRGSVLKNTDWAIGITVYTGQETKIMQNSCKARFKKSLMERNLNSKLIAMFCFILSISLILAIVGMLFERNNVNNGNHWYFFRASPNNRKQGTSFIILWISFITIINAMIPISLYITLELVRVFQAMFVAFDNTMSYNGIYASPRTTTISDDLGQIEYVFSDKTGTLTKNVMEFMRCSIAGEKYGEGLTEVARANALARGIDVPSKVSETFYDSKLNKKLDDENVILFFRVLSCCHSVMVEPDQSSKHGLSYQAPSPDEVALVQAASRLGFRFLGTDKNILKLEEHGKTKNIEILVNLEFTSERKRSSVIVKIDDKILLLCKGADDLILSRLSKDSRHINTTKKHLREFSVEGLRTLCCAYRSINQNEFDDWFSRYNEANCSIEDKEEKVGAVVNEIETNLMLIGATAIEDKLQEGVGDTIHSLIDADIKVWVITGDKRETAVNIAYACKLFETGEKAFVLSASNMRDLRTQIREIEGSIGGRRNEQTEFSLVCTGETFALIYNDEAYQERFVRLASISKSVVCCRVSPIQKAQIVRLIRNKTKSMVLSIGDGANDVSMILEADVGVGISGKEGRQAVLASDYAISQFRFLKRLLFVHGRINFYRNVDIIFYSFYKNMCMTFSQIIYAFFTGFSATTVYDSWLFMTFNVIYTSAPPVIYACLEKDVQFSAMMSNPSLYTFDGKRKEIQGIFQFIIQLLLGVFQSIICFFVCYFTCNQNINSDGSVIGLEQFGTYLYSCVIMVVNVRIMIMSCNWTWLHFLFYFGSILIFPIVLFFMDILKLTREIVGMTSTCFSNFTYYSSVVGATLLASLPVLLYEIWRRNARTKLNELRYSSQ